MTQFNFKFADPADSKAVDLGEVDDELRIALKIPFDKYEISNALWILVEIGTRSFDVDGNFLPEAFDAECGQEGVSWGCQCVFKEFLTKKYKFITWRKPASDDDYENTRD